MASQPKQESIFGRDEEITLFEENLKNPDASSWLLNYYGVKGVGKTELLTHLRDSLPDDTGFMFDLSHMQDDIGSLLHALERRLEDFDLPEEAWEKYEDQKAEIRQNRDANKTQIRCEMNNITVNLSQQVSNGGVISQSPLSVTVGNGQAYREQIRDNEREFWNALMRAFLDLAENLNDRPFIVLLDHWEQLENEMNGRGWPNWVLRTLLIGTQDPDRGFAGFRAVIASESRLSDPMLSNVSSVKSVVFHEVQPFNEAQALQFLEKHHSDPVIRQKIYEVAGGIPGMLCKALEHVPDGMPQSDVDAALKNFVRDEPRRYVERIIGGFSEIIQTLIKYGSILKRWNRQLLSAACGMVDLNENIFNDLIATPYVDPVSGTFYYEFDTEIRAITLENLWYQAPEEFFTTHERAAKWFSVQREDM